MEPSGVGEKFEEGKKCKRTTVLIRMAKLKEVTLGNNWANSALPP